MFSGKNEIVLNAATMREAVTHWLNNRVLGSGVNVRVTHVEEKGSGYDHGFHIEFTPAGDPK